MGADPKWHFSSVDWFNGKTFLRFLKRLVRHYEGRKIYLIVDNAKYHRTKEISQWLTAKTEKIEVHFLPPYSPELNPVELAWKGNRSAGGSQQRWF